MSLVLYINQGQRPGQLGSGYRVVVFSGTATSASYVNSNSFIRQKMIDALVSAGYGIPALRLTSSGYSLSFEIEVSVHPDHTNEWVRGNILAILASINYTYDPTVAGAASGNPIFGAITWVSGVQTSRLLQNVSLYVRSGDDRTTASPGTTPSAFGPPPGPVDNNTNPQNTGGNTRIPDPPADDGSGFLANLAAGLGVGIPTATVVLIGIALFAMKK